MQGARALRVLQTWILRLGWGLVCILVAAQAGAAPVTIAGASNQSIAGNDTTEYDLLVPIDSSIFDLNVAVSVNLPRPDNQTTCTGAPPQSRLDDLTITIISPDGGQPVVLSGQDGGIAERLRVTFDDEAPQSMNGVFFANCDTVSGSYQPQDALSALDHTQMWGVWRLRIDNDGVGGTLLSWSLTFTTEWLFTDGFESGNRALWSSHRP